MTRPSPGTGDRDDRSSPGPHAQPPRDRGDRPSPDGGDPAVAPPRTVTGIAAMTSGAERQ
ncbi:hypothetical protein AB0J37_28755 [Microbispora rosea]|uniref:hypothetical protein n=1 Tax=Microbispora rosea TaxID=58117 RepID=UPI003438A045